jgi:hypothetical protein
MSSWRSARRNGGPPDKRPTVALVASSAIPTRTDGYDERGSALQAKEIRKDGHESAGGKEAEAGERRPKAGADRHVSVGAYVGCAGSPGEARRVVRERLGGVGRGL